MPDLQGQQQDISPLTPVPPATVKAIPSKYSGCSPEQAQVRPSTHVHQQSECLSRA